MPPKYDPVDDSKQLPERNAVTQTRTVRAERVTEVPITTTLPAPLRRRLTIALAVHDIKLKDAMAEAVTAWLEANPDKLEADPGKQE
ncbi:hypothetical protein [Streptomyces sp. NPDC057910]|uniref:hypothetical protein n=1 Tax=Streptomyces sp. NPDC057910 TaxID=3346278 RepID=UPI0036E9DEE3